MQIYKLSQKAEADFRAIWNYTFDKWGEEQADQYTDQLNSICGILANNPKKGKSVYHIRAGYRKYKVGKHQIYFRKSDDGIEIVRILHVSMDVERHL